MTELNYKTQNNELLNNFLNRTFFRSWRTAQDKRDEFMHNYSHIEIQLNPICSTKCQYCYLARFGKELMPPDTWPKKKIIENLARFLNWLTKENMHPHFEIFSGDPFVQEVGFEVLDMIHDWYDGKERISLVVPSNMDFLHYPEKTQRILDYYSKFEKKNISFYVSASVDGKYMEENRPHRSPLLKYDDEYYHNLFTFAKQTGTGFHPMIYSNGIEKWKDNFLWFQEMFKKYEIPFNNLYLLEVRNDNWTKKQCEGLEDFSKFLVNWCWDFCNHDENTMMDFIFEHSGFNFITNGLFQMGRGIGCSLQTALMMRLGDLTFSPCHRLSYDFMNAGRFTVKDGVINGVEAINPSLFFTMNAMNVEAFPMCNNCPINVFCQGGCIGSQYETTGDPFSPIPSVCRLSHHKMRGLFTAYREIGIMPKILNKIGDRKVEAYKFCVKENIL